MVLTRSAYARYRRCSAAAITKAIKRGDVVLTSDDKVDVEASDAMWPLDREPAMEGLDPDGDMSFDEATRRKVAAQAQLAELELKTREGQLLNAADVLRAWQAVLANLRANLRNLPPRLAADMHGLDLVAAEAVALAAIDELLTELSDNPPEVKP